MPAFGRDVIVYLEYHPLPPEYQPARVRRKHGRTLLWIDGDANCLDVLAWTHENLTVPERNYVRAACGQPPIGQPLAEELVTDAASEDAWRAVPVLQAPRRRLLRST